MYNSRTRNIYLLCLTFIFTSLIACQTQSSITSGGTGRIKSGDILKLNHEITIQAHKASITLQDGKIIGAAPVDRFHASCRFVMRKIMATRQKVWPDDLIVTKVSYWEYSTGIGYRTPLSGPDLINYEITFKLHSDKQINIHSLVCQHDDEDIHGRHLCLSEIQQALGSFANIIKKNHRDPFN